MPTSSTATRIGWIEAGRRYDPYFKPDWSPELFRGLNLISHLGVYRAARVREVGGFREGLEGSQDYDMALARGGADRARVVSATSRTSCITGGQSQDRRRSMSSRSHMRTTRRAGRCRTTSRERVFRPPIEPAPRVPYHQRIRYPLPQVLPHVTIIIPTRDRVDLLSLGACAASCRDPRTGLSTS